MGWRKPNVSSCKSFWNLITWPVSRLVSGVRIFPPNFHISLVSVVNWSKKNLRRMVNSPMQRIPSRSTRQLFGSEISTTGDPLMEINRRHGLAAGVPMAAEQHLSTHHTKSLQSCHSQCPSTRLQEVISQEEPPDLPSSMNTSLAP